MNILFLSQWFPYPPDNGSKIRIYNLLRGLAHRHEVTLASFTTSDPENEQTAALRAICREIYMVPWRPFNPRSLQAVTGYIHRKPRYVIDTFSLEMQALIERLLAEGHYDLVIASELGLAGYARSFQGVPALLDEVEQGVYYQRYASETSLFSRLRSGLTWLKQRNYAAGLLRRFKAATVVSQPERDLLCRVAPWFENVELIPNCINLEDYEDIKEEPFPNSLIFSGSLKFSLNAEAMQWFLGQVYPRILAVVPDVHLSITGDAVAAAAVLGSTLPDASGVTMTGYLDDIRVPVASSWASLAPIQTGGGTRLKILESMALKTPVIATSKGAEGLEVQHGKNILIADTPEAFALAVIRLLADPRLREDLSMNAYQLVCQKYDWAQVMPHFLHLVETTAAA